MNDLFLDFETNGLPEWKIPSDDPVQPHIVQMAIIVCDPVSEATIQSADVIVRPDAWEISRDMTDIHGISNSYAIDNGIPEKMAVELLMAMLKPCRKHIAYNVTFDRRIARIALKRYTDEETMRSLYDHPYECAMIQSKKYLGGKNRKLVDAYKSICGKDLVNSHSAMADTVACKDIYYKLREINTESGDILR